MLSSRQLAMYLVPVILAVAAAYHLDLSYVAAAYVQQPLILNLPGTQWRWKLWDTYSSRPTSEPDSAAGGLGKGDYVVFDDTPLAEGAFARRVVAVGDLHGDIGNARRVLQMARVVDADGRWSGDVDVFVQTGDIIDRGDDTIVLFAWMEELRAQAQAVGGTVLSHLGNHEWMNAIGDWRYVYPSEIKTFGGIAARQAELANGTLGKAWAQNYTTASRLPLHPALGAPNTPFPPSGASFEDIFFDPRGFSHAAYSFVHGGLAPSYPALAPFPTAINDISASLLRKLQRRETQPPPHPPAPYPGLPDSATEDEARMYGGDGPVWFRGWALAEEAAVCQAVDAVLGVTGTRRMVMGHTPDFERIVSRCGGKIIIIDTGISHAYGGALSALSATYTLTPAEKGDLEEGAPRWHEHEVVRAVYEDRVEVLVDDVGEVVGDLASWH